MLYRHKISIAFDLVRKSNRADLVLASISSLCEGIDQDGKSLEIPLEEIKSLIVSDAEFVSKQADDLKSFIAKYPDADYFANTGKELTVWQTKLSALKSDADSIAVAVSSVKDETELTEKKILIPADVSLSQEVPYYKTDVWRSNVINDLLDAAYYTLKGINPDDGSLLLLKDVDLKAKAIKYLQTICNFAQGLKDISGMLTVRDYVMENIEQNPGTLSNYIGLNVERLPLFRRLWAK